MPPKAAPKRGRDDAEGMVEREKVTHTTVRSLLSSDAVKLCDLIAAGHTASPSESSLYQTAMELQRGFEMLRKREEDFQKEWDRRMAVLERTEGTIDRLLTAVEDRSNGRRNQRRDDHRDDRRDDRRGDYGYGGGHGGYRQQQQYPQQQQQQQHHRAPQPHPSRAARMAPPEWQPPVDAYDRPGSPGYTTSSPRASGNGGGGDLTQILNSLSGPPQNDGNRPYSPTRA